MYDISKDPKTIVSAAGRPSRGGPAGAPVELVMFDDLECPFCAKMHRQLFPALTNRYGQTVHVVYRDFPLSQHPWAMRAAVDANCVAAQSTQGYWNMVDTIHGHANDFGGAEHSLQKANDALDQMAVDQAKADGLKPDQVSTVQACVKKQDETEIKASVKLGESLEIEATPVLFINGEKLEGAYPLEDVFRMVDQALVAAGRVPPPAYAAPSTGPAKAGN
jgi:protein-disulfide isomerase